MTAMPILLLVALIVGLVYLVYVKFKERELIKQVTPLSRGEWSERRVVLELLKGGINPKAIFHDLYIRKPNGDYTQVDVAVATKAGIIVFEVKDYSGWIFGNEYQKYWTQILDYGREKHRFYNPVMQNAGHIKAIRQRLPQNPGIPIYSVIVFFGNSRLKDVTCNAANATIIYPRSIRSVVADILDEPDANFGNKYEIMDLLTESVQNGNDPNIVSSQLNAAAYYGRNKPQSYYPMTFRSLSRFGGLCRTRRFRQKVGYSLCKSSPGWDW